MVETIGKIREKISKLLNRIAVLENTVKEQNEHFEDFQKSQALEIIQKKDFLKEQLEQQITSNKNPKEIEIFTQQYELSQSILNDLLSKIEVLPLSAPLDTMADFIEIVGTIQDKEKRNGLVVKVVKSGYVKGDELIRPSHVIVVKND